MRTYVENADFRRKDPPKERIKLPQINNRRQRSKGKTKTPDFNYILQNRMSVTNTQKPQKHYLTTILATQASDTEEKTQRPGNSNKIGHDMVTPRPFDLGSGSPSDKSHELSSVLIKQVEMKNYFKVPQSLPRNVRALLTREISARKNSLPKTSAKKGFSDHIDGLPLVQELTDLHTTLLSNRISWVSPSDANGW